MAWQPVPLASGHYTDNARPWANQEVVNWLPVKPERPGTRSELMLRDVPGLRPFSVVGTGPIRGAHNAEGTLFIVSGTGLYRINTLGVASSLGTIPGVGRVSMAHNQITGGNQVVIANGSSGYVFDTTDESLTQITDEGFPGAKSVRFLGQMILYVEPFGRFWGSSDLADATSYNTIFRQEAEGSPDLILHVEPSQGEALVFGKRTIEVWSNQVTENANFQRTTVIERGAASGNAVVTLDNSCIFLGDDGILYRLNGYTPVPISTRPLEFKLKDYDLSKAFAFTWEDAGFKVVYFTVPGGHTWGYDVATGELHRRESYELDRWRLNTLTPFARKWIGGDFADGTLWELDWDYHKEGCDEIVRICRPPMMHNGGNRVRVNGLRLEVDMGEAADPLEASITGALPDGYPGDEVNYQYTIAGYVEGDEVSGIAVTDGALPAGLSISTTGLVTGTRTVSGDYSFTISGTDRCGQAVTLTDDSTTHPFTISGDLPDGVVGQPLSGGYTNTHGVEPITYAVGAGIPTGGTLGTDGNWTGAYTTAGAFAWLVTATDAAGNTATLNDSNVVTGPLAFTARESAAQVYRYNADGNVLSSVSTITGDKFGVAMSRDYTSIWVCDRDNDRLYRLNATTLAVELNVATVSAPLGVVLSPDGATVYVQGASQVRSHAAADGAVIATGTFNTKVGSPSVAIHPDGSKLYTSDSGFFITVDTATLTPSSVALSTYSSVAINPAGTFVYAQREAAATIDVFTAAGAFSHSIAGGSSDGSIAFLPDGSKFYTAGTGGTKVINATTEVSTAVVGIGAIGQHGAAVSADGGTLFVVDNADGRIYEADTATNIVRSNTGAGTAYGRSIASRALP